LIALRRGVQQPRHVKPARAPTRALPGSPEKVLVIMGRLARGECLWHPLDPFINRAGELVWPSPRRPALLLAA
jgi:hypothetical protein